MISRNPYRKLLYYFKWLQTCFMVLFAFVIMTSLPLVAQERYSLSVSNFSGINGVHLNPAATANSKIFVDVNLATFGFSVDNNFAFVHKEDFNFWNLIRTNSTFPSAEIRGEGFDYSTENELISGFARTDLTGPAFSISLGYHSVGFFTKAVAVSSVRNLPLDIAILMFEGLDYEPLHNVDIQGNDVNTAALSWGEVGFNYAYLFKRDHLSNWSIGLNLRRLFGYSGAYLKVKNADLTFVNGDTLDIRDLNADAGYALPIDYDTNEYPGPNPAFKGRGIAMDIGISYRRNKEMKYLTDPSKYCEYNYLPYLYKIGISLLDAGSLRFDNNTQEHQFEDVSAYWQSIDTTEFPNFNMFTRQLSTVFLGDPNASLTEVNNMTINLSTALSVQADYQYYPDWYLSGALILPLKMGEYQVDRPGQIFMSVRYETDLFEVNFPVSLYDFEKPHVGIYGRYSYFSFGTDKLGALMGISDQYGFDFYFSVKYHLKKGHCRGGNSYRDCRHLSF